MTVLTTLENLATDQALLSRLREGDTSSAIRFLEHRQRDLLEGVKFLAKEFKQPELLTNAAVLRAIGDDRQKGEQSTAPLPPPPAGGAVGRCALTFEGEEK
ncbi:MAG: hypothetical protein AAB403_18770 [Planctomycetota bacterium]